MEKNISAEDFTRTTTARTSETHPNVRIDVKTDVLARNVTVLPSQLLVVLNMRQVQWGQIENTWTKGEVLEFE